MANKPTRKGVFKTGVQRDLSINLRMSQNEIDMIDKLCKQRKAEGSKLCSRTDVILLSIQFAMGELSLLDRMELNLMEGKSLFDTANMPVSKYTGKFREDQLTNR